MPGILLLLLIAGAMSISKTFLIPIDLTGGFFLPQWLWIVLLLGLLTWVLKD
ncbi:MAG: hypothetical protein SFW36_02035 [Leptolyngbyaceae cyanobacterium bins.59]|nr:hypothetical protein [Leptolyngbyaceae cyanobacterium bins.59]